MVLLRLMAKYSDTFRKGHIVLPVIFGISIKYKAGAGGGLLSLSPIFGFLIPLFKFHQIFQEILRFGFWGLQSLNEHGYTQGLGIDLVAQICPQFVRGRIWDHINFVLG
jgi:hypothetical protein